MTTQLFERYSRKEVTIIFGLLLIYLLWVGLVVGIRNDHFIFLGIVLTAYFATTASKKFVLAFLFIILYWVIYDSTRVYPNYEFNPVHIQDLYEWEKAWFGIETSEGLLTPNEYVDRHRNNFLEILSGVFYLSWVPVPLLFGLWLFFKDKKLLLQFSFTFFLVNLFGFIVYYLYPAAPPWYVHLHGFEENFNIPGNEAALANVDKLLGINLFNGMYAKNANVFAAVPSMHSAFPLIALYFARKARLKVWTWVFVISCLGIWWAAIYTMHHYIIDVLLGILCALLTLGVFELMLRNNKIQKWLKRYEEVVN